MIQIPEPTDLSESSFRVYHGTRAPLNKILREGLLVRAGLTGKDTRMQMVDDALAAFGYTKDDVPEWLWKGEWNYERTKPPHLHMSLNFGTAAGYSIMGCEITHQIWDHLISWIVMKLKDNEDMTLKDIAKIIGCNPCSIAKKLNGDHSHVFCVEVPRNHIYDEDLAFLMRFWKKQKESALHRARLPHVLSTSTMEVRVLENVPPERFIGIWEVLSEIYDYSKGSIDYDLREVKF